MFSISLLDNAILIIIIVLSTFSLPNHLRTNTSTPSFKRHLKTYISPLPSIPLNNSLLRTADCSRTDAVHKQQKS